MNKKYKEDKATKLSWGLFPHYGFRYCYKYLEDLWMYIKRIFFTIKHTYPPQAKWESYVWMMDYWREVLKYYRYNRTGDPYIIGDFPDRPQTIEENEIAINELLDHMIELIDKMDELKINFNYSDAEIYNNQLKEQLLAKDEFFHLLNKYFFCLWD